MSLLPQFSKILEKIFAARLDSFIEKHDILINSQQTIAQVPPIRVSSESRVIWSRVSSKSQVFYFVGKSSQVKSQNIPSQVESSHEGLPSHVES